MEGATRALQSGVPDNHKGCLDVWNFYLGVRVFFFFFSIYMSIIFKRRSELYRSRSELYRNVYRYGVGTLSVRCRYVIGTINRT